MISEDDVDVGPDLRGLVRELGLTWVPTNERGYCANFWWSVVGSDAPPWYDTCSRTWRLPAAPRLYRRLLTRYLEGPTAAVYVVYASEVLGVDCPALLLAEASRLLALDVAVVCPRTLARRLAELARR